MHRTQRVTIALLYGLLCHGLFAAAVVAAVVSLYSGLQSGLGPFRGWSAAAVDLVLLLQFPIFHSLLLTRRGRGWLRRLAPTGLGDDLSTTTFALVASVQMLLVFVLWSPSGVVWWRPTGAALVATTVLYVGSWGFLLKALRDAGMALQTGALGWLAVARGRRPEYKPFPTHGLFKSCRQPVYLGFALTLWTGPVWSADRLVLAVLWTAYCVVGPLFKEARCTVWYGEAFKRYQAEVPYLVPRLTFLRPRPRS
jgi:protein-S-isoprenylcysteine O-methyltransferase Ste14